jgi:V8-like Glu-specific endopeptidase
MNRKPLFALSYNLWIAMFAFAALAVLCVGQASAQARSQNGITTFTVQGEAPEEQLDFVNAKPMPIPSLSTVPDSKSALIRALESGQTRGTPGYAAGGVGNGIMSPINLGAPAPGKGGVGSEDFGTNNHPFTTARADLSIATNKAFPYGIAGNLYFKIGGSTYICSASLIKRGVIVTAAHCVANYGASQFYSGWTFMPGYRNGVVPFSKWTASNATILTAYYNGTDGCAVYGVVCPDDVALITLAAKKYKGQPNQYPGTYTGWYGYGWNGYGFVNSITQITQLGYPVGLDNAAYMERTDSYGYTDGNNSSNTVIGSNMNGGSSGGPWLVNFGIAPALTGETNGSASIPDIVVGVTSWGYTSTSPKEQGAAPFTSNNIVVLVNAVCSGGPPFCL